MNLSQNTQAILLLTGYFNPSSSTNIKPLTVGEWSRFAIFLKKQNIQPSNLLKDDYLTLINSFTDKTASLERISALLKRGAAMAIALEKWSRANIWVISRADKEYPVILKSKLEKNSPPILYGCGNKSLLSKGGISVVGSRDVSVEDLAYTKQLGVKAAKAGFSIVSGGAKGVDQAAMLAALEAEGTVLGILADSLLKACSSRQYRQHLVNNNLVLITPFYPEAGFNAGNAMQRNKYIYCLSDSAVVVHSGNPAFGKNGRGGGTWTGALENIKKGWVPLWVKQTEDAQAGNALIVQKGANWITDNINNVDIEQLVKIDHVERQTISEDMFASPQKMDVIDENSTKEPVSDSVNLVEQLKEEPEQSAPFEIPETFYQYFLFKAKLLLHEAKPADELLELLNVNKSQLNVWLKKSVEDQIITKLNKPVRYEWRDTSSNTQGDLL